MTEAFDEVVAWDLLRQVLPASVRSDPQRIHHDSSRDRWLQVRPDGSWTASSTPTEAASGLLDLFLPLRLQRDLVIAQVGQSLDGRIATVSGHSHYVTGPEDIERLHRLRALVDAVVVGVGTVESDDPSLTVREVSGDSPVRVVLDPRGRARPDRRIFTDGAAPTLWVRSQAVAGSDPRLDAEETGEGSEGVAMAVGSEGSFDPHRVLAMLAERGLGRILVEGGAETVSRFLEAGALDRLHVTVAPIIIGSGKEAFGLSPIDRLDEALRPAVRQFRLGRDTLFDLDMRAP